jgi:hypothetical protein
VSSFHAPSRSARRHRTPPRLIYRVHQSPGRLRLRASWLHDRPDEATALADALADLDGVAGVRVRAFTGSVLLLFDPARTDEARLTAAVVAATGVPRVSVAGEETRDEIRSIIQDSTEQGSELSRVAVRVIERLHVDFLRLTGGRVSLGAMLAVGMWTGAAVRVAAAGRLELPPWHQLLWLGFRSFVELEQRAIKQVVDPLDIVGSDDDE